jgi:hypothetical protein
MEGEKQENVSKFYGVGRMIARKTGYSEEHISGVLTGKRSRNGKKGRHIIQLAQQLTEILEQIRVEDDQEAVNSKQ